jgi:hypothetical protein
VGDCRVRARPFPPAASPLEGMERAPRTHPRARFPPRATRVVAHARVPLRSGPIDSRCPASSLRKPAGATSSGEAFRRVRPPGAKPSPRSSATAWLPLASAPLREPRSAAASSGWRATTDCPNVLSSAANRSRPSDPGRRHDPASSSCSGRRDRPRRWTRSVRLPFRIRTAPGSKSPTVPPSSTSSPADFESPSFWLA